jgi:hypothetical protein
MVDDNLVATVGAERGLHGLGNIAACLDVANDGTILGVVAGGWFSMCFAARIIYGGEIAYLV